MHFVRKLSMNITQCNMAFLYYKMCSFFKWNSLDFAAVIRHVSRHPMFLNLSLHSALPADECMQAFQLINSKLKNSA